MQLLRHLLASAFVLVAASGIGCPAWAAGSTSDPVGETASPLSNKKAHTGWESNRPLSHEFQNRSTQQQPDDLGSQTNRGLGAGAESVQNQMEKIQPKQLQCEAHDINITKPDLGPWQEVSANGWSGAGMNNLPNYWNEPKDQIVQQRFTNGYGVARMYGLQGETNGSASPPVLRWPGTKYQVGSDAMVPALGDMVRDQLSNDPEGSRPRERANNRAMQGARASSAGEDSKLNAHGVFDTYLEGLINVANENAASPCSSSAVSKTYSNVVWMVQRMYKQCFLPMALLFLLPGALITQAKGLVSNAFFNEPTVPDPDRSSPFIGIARAMIAIFLIPATQLAVSYCIDVGNSLEDACHQYVNMPLIYMWCEEQMQTLNTDQQGKLIQNLPNVPNAAYRGKFAGMPTNGAILEQMSGLDLALAELVNECYHMLTLGLDIISAFQLVFMCYLFLLGPLAAAFFAWPHLGRDLFRKVFSAWLDGVVILSLWKFWWNVVLICMTVRLESGGINPYDPWEVYYLIAFFSILLCVPFNPFDFSAGQIVSFVLGKAEGVVSKVAQGGKSSGGGGGGKGGAKGHASSAQPMQMA